MTDYVNQPWRFKRVLDGRRIQDAGREDSDTLDTFDATDLRNIDPGKHTLCAPFSTDDSAADASASPAGDKSPGLRSSIPFLRCMNPPATTTRRGPVPRQESRILSPICSSF